MSDYFKYDVFLNHSSNDKNIVREIANRLKNDGLRVWFDEWELRPGDNKSAKIEEGLERSRVLVFCMSANTLGSEWAKLEASTFRFRDPLFSNRRFIPLRLDDATIKGFLVQFPYIDWLPQKREQEYAKLLRACSPTPKQNVKQLLADLRQFEHKIISLGHTAAINSIALSSDGRRALSGAGDNTVRVWDVENGLCECVLEGHTDCVRSVAFNNDGRRALSGADDKTVRVWDVESGQCELVLEGHTECVRSVALSSDGRRALSGAGDYTVRIWDVESGQCQHILKGHTGWVRGVALSNDGHYALSGADDNTVRIWNIESGRCERVLEGHRGTVKVVVLNSNGRCALSGAGDKTIRVWDVKSGQCLKVLEGHTDWVRSVALSSDGRRALSGADDKAVRVWNIENGQCELVLEGHTDEVNAVAWSNDEHRTLSGSGDKTVRIWDVESGRCKRILEGHINVVSGVALSSDGNCIISGGNDKTVRAWNVESGRCERVLEGHTDAVYCVALSRNGNRAVSGAKDNTVRVWDVESGRCEHVLEGHSGSVNVVSWSNDGHRTLSAASDNTIRVWNVESGRYECILEGHTGSVNGVSWSKDGHKVLSAANDKTVSVWDLASGRCERSLVGHTDAVHCVALSRNGNHAVSGAKDNTLRVWDVESGRCERVLEGHIGSVNVVSWSNDGQRILSAASDNTVRVWNVENGHCERVLEGHIEMVNVVAISNDRRRALSAAVNGVLRVWDMPDLATLAQEPEVGKSLSPSLVDQIKYTNAKVLLVGDSAVGKTGLSNRLAMDKYENTDSTVGAWATQWKVPIETMDGVEREIWLWDFGGQADQRLIHQLYMDQTHLAVLVFDPQEEDLFDTLRGWDRALTRAATQNFKKLLIAGRIDAGGLRSVSRANVLEYAKENGFACYLETSAKENVGCDELKQMIVELIDWDEIVQRTTPALFRRLKEEIVRLKDKGRMLMRFNDLRDTLILRLGGKQFSDDELKTVLSLLTGPGVVWELGFGSWILLQPELINSHAQAVIRSLYQDKREIGCIAEEKVLNGKLAFHESNPRLALDEERIVLLAMHRILVERGLCLRDEDPENKGPTMLIFPSYARRERPDLVEHPSVIVSYQFNGFLDDIYATLVVRLHHTQPFDRDQLWRDAADFKTMTNRRLGVKLTRLADGAGELEVYFDPNIPVEEMMIFSKYVHEHLLKKSKDVVRLRHYMCEKCQTPVRNRDVAMRRLAAKGKKASIICVECEKRVKLWDALEEHFADNEVQMRVHELEEQSRLTLDTESKERVLVGEIVSTVALAGQICREFTVSDKGIDMEVEFNTDEGEATGRKVYLQLKSGDSHLKTRKQDGAETFAIKKERHAKYWMDQAFPVMLIIRNSKGEISWMEIRDHLKKITNNGIKQVKQIVFEGKRFDVMSVRDWREQVLQS